MPEFKAGDIVMLKSGGPKMTVMEQASTGSFICQWFKGASLERGAFPATSLVLVEEDE